MPHLNVPYFYGLGEKRADISKGIRSTAFRIKKPLWKTADYA